ncbi:MAG: hypothetical protein DWQ42_11900 [Planctomycetota bacterium]|nr:MAG: hypothetical protein DWQ42_11900 [Planctomycetota bacterium]
MTGRARLLPSRCDCQGAGGRGHCCKHLGFLFGGLEDAVD